MPDTTPAKGWHYPNALRMLGGSEYRGFSWDNAEVLAGLMAMREHSVRHLSEAALTGLDAQLCAPRALVQAMGNPATELLHGLTAFHILDTAVGQAIQAAHGIDYQGVTNQVFDQASNRLHTIKAILFATLGG